MEICGQVGIKANDYALTELKQNSYDRYFT